MRRTAGRDLHVGVLELVGEVGVAGVVGARLPAVRQSGQSGAMVGRAVEGAVGEAAEDVDASAGRAVAGRPRASSCRASSPGHLRAVAGDAHGVVPARRGRRGVSRRRRGGGGGASVACDLGLPLVPRGHAVVVAVCLDRGGRRRGAPRPRRSAPGRSLLRLRVPVEQLADVLPVREQVVEVLVDRCAELACRDGLDAGGVGGVVVGDVFQPPGAYRAGCQGVQVRVGLLVRA